MQAKKAKPQGTKVNKEATKPARGPAVEVGQQWECVHDPERRGVFATVLASETLPRLGHMVKLVGEKRTRWTKRRTLWECWRLLKSGAEPCPRCGKSVAMRTDGNTCWHENAHGMPCVLGLVSGGSEKPDAPVCDMAHSVSDYVSHSNEPAKVAEALCRSILDSVGSVGDRQAIVTKLFEAYL